jgi:hypothetical protein
MGLHLVAKMVKNSEKALMNSQKNGYTLDVMVLMQDLDADIEEAHSERSYLSQSSIEEESRLRAQFMEVHSPATPSMQTRGTLDIDALSGLVDAMRRTAAEGLLDTSMDLEELDGDGLEDLDAEIEDMDEFQTSFVEEGSMEL